MNFPVLTSTTDGAETSKLVLQTRNSGSMADKLTLDHTGAMTLVGASSLQTTLGVSGATTIASTLDGYFLPPS